MRPALGPWNLQSSVGRGSRGQEHLPPALLRLSVGTEAVEDLWSDLDNALRLAVKP